jgi:hypothetical protein
LGDVLNAPLIDAWEKMCEKYGISEWCINEGRADKNDTVEVLLEDAIYWGLIESDDNNLTSEDYYHGINHPNG